MTNNILWYQPEELNNDDVIISNGKILPKDIEYNNCFRQLMKVSDMAINHKSPWCGNVNGFFFVKGWFDALDKKGRRLPFMFVSDKKDGYKTLIYELNRIGYTMDHSTENSVKRRNVSLYSKIAVIISIFIIIILTIVYYGNKN